MLISIIICSYNRADYILNAIDSLVKQDFDTSNFEIIVVDNNSKDNTKFLVENYIKNNQRHHIIYINETNQGASFARNNGASIAKGKLYCFIDDDAIAQPDFLKNIEIFYQANESIAGFGGRIIPLYIPEEPKWMSHYTSSLVGNFNYSNKAVEFNKNRYPLESNMIVTAQAFHQVNGFNIKLPGVVGTLRIGGEGKDFFMRMKACEHQIFYVPNIIVLHVVETKKLTREYMYRVASGIGRGERERIKSTGIFEFAKKIIEYIFKYFASITIGLSYIIKGQSAKCKPLINFRWDVLKGFLGY
jgi:glucosyl-dolichyl phosphate glucuronosyltransferase